MGKKILDNLRNLGKYMNNYKKDYLDKTINTTTNYFHQMQTPKKYN
jgi:hypothetical protein